jgi:uncharacterized protein (TIGR02466 family)
MPRLRAWFPTFVYQAPLGGRRPAAFLKSIHDECLRVRAHDDPGRAWSKEHYPGGFTSYATLCRLQRQFSTFMELEKRLAPHVRAFARRLDWDVDPRRLRMTDCWINVMPRHVVHGLHLHPASVVSGTYYVQTPPGCSALRLEDPRLDRFMAAPGRRADARPENLAHVYYPARAGGVILFESWLRHEVPPNPSARERISVSFNYEVS